MAYPVHLARHRAAYRGFLQLAIVAALLPIALQAQSTAIVGATVIDGNGGAPLPNATVVIEGSRITSVGPSASTDVPAGAEVIDGSGKFLTPGFVDTNVHISLYGGGAKDRKETSVHYRLAGADLTLEAAQMHLKFGVTHLRDSYGALPELKQVRDAIASGDDIGPRLQVAGNIVGWGGPYSITFALIAENDLSLYEQQFSDRIAQGTGEELMDMYPEELRVAISEYLDKGVDFLKYGGTSIDLIQHPEVLADREISDALVTQIREREIVCSMLVNTITGPAWQQHLEQKEAAEARMSADDTDEWGRLRRPVEREKTSFELRRERNELGHGAEMRRLNAEKLIAGGCIVTLGTDNYAGVAPEFARSPKPIWQEPGIGTLLAIEGLVELGMTPSDAIVAATRNGALAARGLDDFGTIEVGKFADLLLLDADPLEDIANIRKQSLVMVEGVVVDVAALPTRPVMFRR